MRFFFEETLTVSPRGIWGVGLVALETAPIPPTGHGFNEKRSGELGGPQNPGKLKLHTSTTCTICQRSNLKQDFDLAKIWTGTFVSFFGWKHLRNKNKHRENPRLWSWIREKTPKVQMSLQQTYNYRIFNKPRTETIRASGGRKPTE